MFSWFSVSEADKGSQEGGPPSFGLALGQGEVTRRSPKIGQFLMDAFHTIRSGVATCKSFGSFEMLMICGSIEISKNSL